MQVAGKLAGNLSVRHGEPRGSGTWRAKPARFSFSDLLRTATKPAPRLPGR